MGRNKGCASTSNNLTILMIEMNRSFKDVEFCDSGLCPVCSTNRVPVRITRKCESITSVSRTLVRMTSPPTRYPRSHERRLLRSRQLCSAGCTGGARGIGNHHEGSEGGGQARLVTELTEQQQEQQVKE
jgi:hypothetical protein